MPSPIRILLASGVALLALAGPAQAQRASTCTYDSGTRTVEVTVLSARVDVARDVGGAITFNGVACGEATVLNTDLVRFHEPSSAAIGSLITISLAGGPFAPGATDEPGDSDEIEFEFSGGIEKLEVRGSAGPDTFVGGGDGVNLNAAEIDGIDRDIDRWGNTELFGEDGSDELSIAGGAGTTLGWSDTATGGAGDDHIVGSGGNDHIRGGPGNDRIDGGGAQDFMYGDEGDDLLTGGPESHSSDVFSGGPGNDRLEGSGRQDRAWYFDAEHAVAIDMGTGVVADDGWGGIDTLVGVEAVDTGAYDDTIIGSPGNDYISTGFGDDVVESGGGDDGVRGEGGNDLIDLGPGNDHGNGGLDDDILHGGEGDDDLTGYHGNDTFDGGLGRDRATIGENRPVEADLGADRARFKDGSGEEPLLAVEDFTGSSRDDLITGDEGPNSLHSGGGNDLVRGLEGADEIGSGYADYSGAPHAIVVEGGRMLDDGYGYEDRLGTGAIIGTPFDDTVTAAYHSGLLVLGGDGNDTLRGGNERDTLRGEGGDDDVSGAGEGDTLSGGPGVDRLTGGGDGTWKDVLDYSAASEGVTLDLTTGTVAADGYGGVDAGVDGFEEVRGSRGDDRILGSSVAEHFEPGYGDDVVAGGDGADTIVTSPGNDTLSGGEGTDLLTFRNASSGVEVDLAAGSAERDGRGGRDTLAGFENVHDSSGSDVIAGDDGPNKLENGGSGNDVLYGRGGDDELYGSGSLSHGHGGAGSDRLDGPSLIAAYSDAPNGIRADISAGTVSDDGYGSTDRMGYQTKRVAGSEHADVVDVGPMQAWVDGRGGDDRITGGSVTSFLDGGGGDDVVTGGSSGDSITGGSGRDELSGNGGGDIIAARDTERDAVTCGEAVDRVTADGPSVDAVADDCESVARSEDPPPPDEGPPPADEGAGGGDGGGGDAGGGTDGGGAGTGGGGDTSTDGEGAGAGGEAPTDGEGAGAGGGSETPSDGGETGTPTDGGDPGTGGGSDTPTDGGDTGTGGGSDTPTDGGDTGTGGETPTDGGGADAGGDATTPPPPGIPVPPPADGPPPPNDQPPPTDPPATDPPRTDPPSDPPPPHDPPADQPPSNDPPPATDPPNEEPPADDPPTTQPPPNDPPPATDPPASDPPPDDQPASSGPPAAEPHTDTPPQTEGSPHIPGAPPVEEQQRAPGPVHTEPGDVAAPRLSARLDRRKRTLVVDVSESATVTLRVSRPKKPRRLDLDAGRHRIKLGRLPRRGRIALSLRATDVAGNVSRPLRLLLRRR